SDLMFDMLAVSSHDKTLEQRAQFAWEIEQNKALLRRLAMWPVKRRKITLGNHDVRPMKFLSRVAPELSGVVSIESLLGLESEFGWEVHPYQTHFKVGKVNFVHDVGSSGKNADKELGATFEASAVQGHTHRAGLTYFGNADGETHVAATLGWLGSKKAAEYLAKVKV